YRRLPRRRDPIFAIEDHRVGEVDHQHRGGARLMIRFVDLEILLRQIPVLDAGAAIGIGEGARDIEQVRIIAEPPCARFGQSLIPHPGERCLVIAPPALTQLPENFLEGALPETALGTRRHLELADLILLEVAPLLQFLDEIADARLLSREPVSLVELCEPAERLRDIARRMLEELLKEIEEFIEQRAGVAVPLGIPLEISDVHG